MEVVMNRKKRKGFTFVELLVVIGIIALLISILLPSLSRAREQANRVRCLSNLRSLGQAMYLYANTYRDRLPNGNFPGAAEPDKGVQVLVPLCEDYASVGVFRCPSDNDPLPLKLTQNYIGLQDSARMSYDFYSLYWVPEQGPKLARLRSQAPLAWDLFGGSTSPSSFQNHGVGGGNVVYSDGHADWQRQDVWEGKDWPSPASEFYPGASPVASLN
jgi:prepilin-type N-terminal cleavage/methylation domain-containing protein